MIEAQGASGLFQVRDRDGAMTEMGAHQTSRRGLPHDRCLPYPDRRNLSPELANGEFGAAIGTDTGGSKRDPGGGDREGRRRATGRGRAGYVGQPVSLSVHHVSADSRS
jgi:hypothetical protein